MWLTKQKAGYLHGKSALSVTWESVKGMVSSGSLAWKGGDIALLGGEFVFDQGKHNSLAGNTLLMELRWHMCLCSSHARHYRSHRGIEAGGISSRIVSCHPVYVASRTGTCFQGFLEHGHGYLLFCADNGYLIFVLQQWIPRFLYRQWIPKNLCTNSRTCSDKTSIVCDRNTMYYDAYNMSEILRIFSLRFKWGSLFHLK